MFLGASQVALVVKNPPASAGVGSSPGLGRSPGGGHGNPLQYSYLENPMDRGARWATIHRIAQGWTWLKRLSMHTCNILLHVYFTFQWSIHQLMGFWVIFTLWLLWIMLLQTFTYKVLCGHMFTILSGIYPRLELVSHMITLCLTLKKNFFTNNFESFLCVRPGLGTEDSEQIWWKNLNKF